MKINITPEMRIRLAYAESIEIELPDGWRLVPVDATKDWVKNMRETCAYTKGACEHLIRIVLAAAPEVKK